MTVWDRQQALCELLETENELPVSLLATRLDVSAVTVRKDIEELVKRGRVERAHGVVRLSPYARRRYSLEREMRVEQEEKERIAAAAYGMVEEGEAVFIGPGSTCATIMKKLVRKNNIVIITNAVNFEPLLEQKSNSRIIFLGGEYSFTQGAVMGIISLDTLDSLNITKFFLGANAISAEGGLCSENLNDTGFIKMMVERSKEIIAVACHKKIGKTAAIRLIPLAKITKIITGGELNEIEKQTVEKTGVELILV